jgi:asparagine synthase (glutamine-hydrolysing)
MIRSLFHRSRDRALSLTLSPLARDVLRLHITPLTPQKLQTIEQYAKIVDQRKIAGDFVECGLNLGGSAIVLASLLSRERRFRGYDMVDQSHSGHDPAGHDPETGEDTVARNFAKLGIAVDGQRIALRAATLRGRLPLDPDRAIALAHINCDWPATGSFYLHAIAPRMPAGAFILLDERHDRAQCQNVADQFLSDRPDFSLESSARGSIVMLCNRRESRSKSN